MVKLIHPRFGVHTKNKFLISQPQHMLKLMGSKYLQFYAIVFVLTIFYWGPLSRATNAHILNEFIKQIEENG